MVDIVELEEQCRKAAADDVSLASDAALFGEVRGLAAVRAALDT